MEILCGVASDAEKYDANGAGKVGAKE